MNRGWFKIWRKIEDSAVFADARLLKLFILCLARANHKLSHVAVDGVVEPVTLQPGQFITGRFELHKAYYKRKKKTNVSPLTVWRWLQTLQKLQNLNMQSNNRFSIVTICNWERYQSQDVESEQPSEQQVNNRRTTDEQQMNTDKNVKTVKNAQNVKEDTNNLVQKNSIPYALILKTWNRMATQNGLKTIRAIKGDRRQHIRARWKDADWRENWQGMLEDIPNRGFCMGQNDRNWRANFNWFIKPGKVNALIEGGYQGRVPLVNQQDPRDVEPDYSKGF